MLKKIDNIDNIDNIDELNLDFDMQNIDLDKISEVKE